MRLVCPNCGAQYEVPDEVIPASGRDVQCSNCGDTWFQHHPDQDPGLAAELGEELAPEPELAEPQTEPAPQEEPAPLPERTNPPVSPPRRKELDPSVADVLREEAAREAEARKRESEPLEGQPDLGLQDPDDEAARRQKQASERMARIRGQEPEAAAAAAAPSGSKRRDVLPDIEEINSTLRKNSERRQTPTELAESAASEDKSTGGFRQGFILIVALAALLLLVYVFAPQIAKQVPALSNALEGYVLTVNELRQWLDEQIRGAMGTLDSMSSESGPAQQSQ